MNRRTTQKPKDDRFERLALDQDGRTLICRFTDGRWYELPATKLAADHKHAKITRWRLRDRGLTAEIEFSDGAKTDFAPDFVLHHCEPAFEYFASKVKPSKIGKRVRRRRTERGLTLADLERKTGIHVSNLSRLEACRHNPSWDTLERVAAALGLPVVRLIGED
jgi:DNA-binding XRE family transcriptional regulator